MFEDEFYENRLRSFSEGSILLLSCSSSIGIANLVLDGKDDQVLGHSTALIFLECHKALSCTLFPSFRSAPPFGSS
jgi:hypothetical protein